jgi:hypothetical protein
VMLVRTRDGGGRFTSLATDTASAGDQPEKAVPGDFLCTLACQDCPGTSQLPDAVGPGANPGVAWGAPGALTYITTCRFTSCFSRD